MNKSLATAIVYAITEYNELLDGETLTVTFASYCIADFKATFAGKTYVVKTFTTTENAEVEGFENAYVSASCNGNTSEVTHLMTKGDLKELGFVIRMALTNAILKAVEAEV